VLPKIGKLLSSLQYHVDKNINDTLYRNETFLSSKWNLREHNILCWSQRYIYYIGLAIVLAILTVINLILWKEELTPLVIKFIPHWKTLANWQDVLLTGQLTILGVVYPLVIGLIGVLLKNASAKTILLQVYREYSGFMYAGLSGLTLSIVIVAGFFISATVDPSTYIAICITTAVWFTFNIILTMWFFTSTFLFLDDTKRTKLLIRYSIHEICEADIRNRLHSLLLQTSVGNNLVVNPSEEVLKVSSYKWTDDKLKITVYSEEEISVSNVYFAIINAVIRYHVIKLEILRWFNNEEWGGRLAGKAFFRWMSLDNEAERELVVEPNWSKGQRPGLNLVQYSGFTIGAMSKALIKASFKTQRVKQEQVNSLSFVIAALVGLADDAIREKNIVAFRAAVSNIAEWHGEIASALSFFNDKKEDDNWLLLPTDSLFSRNYLEEILKEYYRLAGAAVELIDENIEFFKEIIYLHKRVFSKREKLVNREGHLLIQGSYITWPLLMEWRSYSSSSSDIRIANNYEGALYEFIGSWESWTKYYITARNGRLDDLANSLPLTISHLEFTAQTVISALRHNNIEAAGWGVDMLNKWVENVVIRGRQTFVEYTWYSQLVTHDMLLQEPQSQVWLTALNGNDFLPSEAFNIAIKNACFDLRVITACYILSKPNVNSNEQIKKYIKALLDGTEIHPPGVRTSSVTAVHSASDLLDAYFRHRDYSNYGEGSYGSWLSKVLAAFGRVNETRAVSGRVYSGWGQNDPRSMSSAYVEIALSFSGSPWRVSQKLLDILFSKAFEHNHREQVVEDLNDWLRLCDQIKEPILIDKEHLKSHQCNFKASIHQLIDEINDNQHAAISNAQIDKGIIARFELACSKAITKDEQYPISLFSSVNFNTSTSGASSHQINIENYSKAQIAQTIDANRPVNEDDWFEEVTRDHVKIEILRELISYKASDKKEYRSEENSIRDVLDLAKDINNPVFFTANVPLNRVLRKAGINKELADKFNISFIDGYGKYYICHIGNAVAFSLPFTDVEYSLLTTKALFKSVTFSQNGNNQFVQVGFKESDEDESIGVLSLSYWMDIELTENLPFIKMTVIKEKEE
tara:strand:+ start:3456 stop:6722 length:3267 start_codon:yes stop_codon:yes gene_type:complete